jgi:VanZ family protein
MSASISSVGKYTQVRRGKLQAGARGTRPHGASITGCRPRVTGAPDARCVTICLTPCEILCYARMIMEGAAGGRMTRRTGGLVGALAAWGPVVLCMAAIFLVSSNNTWTVFEGPPLVRLLRKSGHVFEYALLALLLGRAFMMTWTRRGETVTKALLGRAWAAGAVVCTVYAMTDELHQLFVPKRVGYVWDVLVDALSAVAALGLWYIVRGRSLANRASPITEKRDLT